MLIFEKAPTVDSAHLLRIAPESAAFFRLGLHVAVEKHIVCLHTFFFQDFGNVFWFLEKVEGDMLSM